MTAGPIDPATEAVALTPAQVAFFRCFGFVHLHGLFEADRDDLEAGFEEAFASEATPFVLPADNPYHQPRDHAYDEVPRQIVPGFIDRSPRLARLRTDPRIVGAVTSLLGDDYEYAESDGNRFNCDVYWHLDTYGSSMQRDSVKLYFYLDRLTAETGALRVIPGTYYVDSEYAELLRHDLYHPDQILEKYGVEADEIPSWTIETQPGDVIAGDFRTLHGSFGGAAGRRLFTVNFRRPQPD